MLLINSLKVEKDGENCLFQSLRVTNTVCRVAFPQALTHGKSDMACGKITFGQERKTLRKQNITNQTFDIFHEK